MRQLILALALIAGATHFDAFGVASALAAQAPTTAAAPVASRITVTVPQDDAELLVNGEPATDTVGRIREIESRPLEPGRDHEYTFSVSWRPNNYTLLFRNRTVRFRAGEAITVDLATEDPNDRVQVRYVPTPDPIVAEMVKLAAITTTDVVFEPGCGDSRITIAAVKAGARRGVGVDIDPERVAESNENVKAAALQDRIEIRLGDALDIPDLADATVVFLYMGDDFGRLIVPQLVRDLKVGSRIVSHRFLLGDWTPDETITIELEGSTYLLHRWTVTQAVKAGVSR
jgi:uncharacterized protein (TIGR03000 family)